MNRQGDLMDQNTLILIPSRFASTRFPGKPLALISGKPMIQRVYEGCENIKNAKVCVVTDDSKIEDCVKAFGGSVVRVDDDVVSGSERIYLAYKRYFCEQNFKFIVNVQGDEPLIQSNLLEKLIQYHQKSSFDVATVVKPMLQSDSSFLDPNKVKAIFNNQDGRCHYFTRASAPFNRSAILDAHWFLHIGIYSYKPSALEEFCKLEQSVNEKLECLEQLRLIDNGFSIGAITSTNKLAGVDSPEDVEYIERILNEKE